MGFTLIGSAKDTNPRRQSATAGKYFHSTATIYFLFLVFKYIEKNSIIKWNFSLKQLIKDNWTKSKWSKLVFGWRRFASRENNSLAFFFLLRRLTLFLDLRAMLLVQKNVKVGHCYVGYIELHRFLSSNLQCRSIIFRFNLKIFIGRTITEKFFWPSIESLFSFVSVLHKNFIKWRHASGYHASECAGFKSLSNKSETGNMAGRADGVFSPQYSMFCVLQVNLVSIVSQQRVHACNYVTLLLADISLSLSLKPLKCPKTILH